MAANTLKATFKGGPDSISILSTLIQNGAFMPGGGESINPYADDQTITDLENAILKGFYGFAIPSVWTAAGSAPFVMTINEACDTIDNSNSIYNYLTDDGAIANGCFQNLMYYLVYPPDGKDRFDALPGSSDLATSQGQTTPWGGVTVQDLITGSLNSYTANGNQNGAPIASGLDPKTLSDLTMVDITTPGYVRLPVCSGATAMAAYTNPSRVDTSDPNYPCVALQGITDCEEGGAHSDTSDGSPLITDCQDIINNIQGTSGEWTTTLSRTRQLVQAGTCAFSVEEDTDQDNGNASYKVGSQDIVNIISNAIKQFGSNGKVGAHGVFDCKGNIKTQPEVKWYLYHT